MLCLTPFIHLETTLHMHDSKNASYDKFQPPQMVRKRELRMQNDTVLVQ